ncbi:hypothetical protein RJ55_06138 [Drechmeria coniospora]|nr:hypothetical protein RJ55_06138 [Drechmeria coniospora]
MSAQLIPSDPDTVMVIRNVTPNVATFSVPFLRFGRIRVGGRGTLVKLSSGALAVFSPVALTPDAKAKVTEMGGNVGYIVALDIEHHIFLSEWAKAYPNAKIVGPEGLQEKRSKQQADPKIGDEQFDTVFTKANKAAVRIGTDFDADFEYEYLDGHSSRELVFCYKPDGVLIEADLMFNLPAVEQYSKVPATDRRGTGVTDKLFNKLQTTSGDATWMKRFNWYLAAKDKASVTESVKRIAAWNFTTLIPCHGDVIEGDGKQVFEKVFSWHLTGKR